MTDLASDALRDRLDQLLVTARGVVAESLDLDTVLLVDRRRCDDAPRRRQRRHPPVGPRARRPAGRRVSNFPPDMLGFEMRFGEGMSSRGDHRPASHRSRGLRQVRASCARPRPVRLRIGPVRAVAVPWRGHRGDQRPRPGRRHTFPPGSADLLAAFAGHAAIAIDHARRYENEVNLGRDLAETNRELTRCSPSSSGWPSTCCSRRARRHRTVLAEDLGRTS